MKRVKTVCPRDCYDTCFLTAYVDDSGQIRGVSVDSSHQLTQGFTCLRVAREVDHVYVNRVCYPYVRMSKKPGRHFKRVSWSEALDLVAQKLGEVLDEYGPSAVLHLEGAGNRGLLTQYFPQRLWYAIGACKADYTGYSKSGHEAISLHYGSSYGALPEEFPDMKFIVFWGFNAVVSALHIWTMAEKARKNGAKIAVVDPRRSETAKRADFWVSPRPGSDVALAYGVARYLIEEGYVDEEFVEKHTYGFEKFKDEVMKWTPEKVEATTGVKWSTVERLGELYGSLTPSVTLIGLGLQKSTHGTEAIRAVSLIPALLGLHRGFYYTNSQGWPVDIQYITGEKLTSKEVKSVNPAILSDYVVRGDFKFIFICNVNPAITLPNQSALRRGLLRDDLFVVVHETHWTETCDFADVVLPAPTYLEKYDLVLPHSHRYVRISRKAIQPVGESKDEICVMREIAKRIGVRDKWVYDDPWRVLRKALNGALEGGSFDDLVKGETFRLRMKPRDEYQTPTGKIEFYSTKAEKIGVSPLPQQMPIPSRRGENLILLNSATPKYINTQFREHYGPIPPIAVVNPKDAEKLGVSSGDLIRLGNELGEVVVRAIVSDDVPEGVVWTPRQLIGLNNEPLNTIIPSQTAMLDRGSVFNMVQVKVAPLYTHATEKQ